MTDRVQVVDYDPAWPGRFAEERDAIGRALGLEAAAFEHIGSTAVPGLAAKPTIDLMIGVEPLTVEEGRVEAMERLGYAYLGEYGIPGRHFFRKGRPPTHHVHLVRRGADFWTKQLVFRDYLRATPAEHAPYARLKRGLATRFAADRAAYTAAKTDFIARLQECAWLWAGAALVVCDLEATCWEGGQPPERMEAIEIGALRLDARLEPSGAFERFVRPKDEPALSEFCARLTSIRQEDVDAAQPFPAVLSEFAAWAGPGLYRLASWSGYDLSQLRRDCARHAMPMPAALERHLDLQELYARLRGAPPCPMAAALAREGLGFEGRQHRGVDDARNAARLARLIIQEMIAPQGQA